MATARKLGRPPDTSSEETRRRILEAARRCFAANGYEATSNRQLADSAGLTTGAIYHYFGSKRDLFAEAYAAVQEIVYGRFEAAMAAAPERFVDRVNAVLDEAHVLNREDPSLAQFLVAVRTDVSRDPELGADERFRPSNRIAFFGDLIELGVRHGEIRAEDARTMFDVISAVMMGLVSASSDNPETHARAVGGFKALVSGTLIDPDA